MNTPSATRVSKPLRLSIATASWTFLALIVVLGAVFAFAVPVADARHAAREVLFNVGHWLRWPLYVLTGVVFAVLALGPFRRAQLWRLGKSEKRWDRIGERAKVFLVYGIGQGRMPNDLYASIMHLFIFWGWVVLFIGTVLSAIHTDVVYFLEGRVYLTYSVVLDVFGLVALIGLAMALVRRYILKPPKLRLGSLWDDVFLLWLMLAIVLTGFLIEGMRIGANELVGATFNSHGGYFIQPLGGGVDKDLVANPQWSPWSPVGWTIAKAFDGIGVSGSAMLDIHKVVWFIHLPMALAWTAWLGYGKISHIILGSANIFARNLSSPKGLIAGSALTPIRDFENAESFGAGRLADFTWKQLADVDVCVRCGRCEANCPASLTGKELTPMGFLQDIKVYLNEAGPKLLEQKRYHESVEPIEGERMIAGDVVSRNVIWDCVTCGACETQCPVMIEHIGTLQDMRRYVVMTEGEMPPSAQAVLTQLEQRGHPWRGTTLTRTSWMEGLEVPAFDGSQEYLYWVGCSGALVDRNIPITRAVARLLKQAEVSYGCLGDEETCSGDPARRLGNEYLAQMQIKGLIATLKGKSVQKVITNCPHCFNIFRNEYPQFEGSFEVYHHTEMLAGLIAGGKLQPKLQLEQKVTYHDSCYLGRHNGQYSAPRQIIKALPNVEFVEMPRNERTSFCCGAGGGHMFVDESKGRRINHVRTEEAQATGAGVIASNCPFCIQMFEDGVSAVEADETKRMKPMDLAEILELAVLGKPAPRS